MNILSENYRRYRRVRKAYAQMWRVRKSKAHTEANLKELQQKEKMLKDFIEANNDLKIIPPTEN